MHQGQWVAFSHSIRWHHCKWVEGGRGGGWHKVIVPLANGWLRGFYCTRRPMFCCASVAPTHTITLRPRQKHWSRQDRTIVRLNTDPRANRTSECISLAVCSPDLQSIRSELSLVFVFFRGGALCVALPACGHPVSQTLTRRDVCLC